jgi:hypothetical protein
VDEGLTASDPPPAMAVEHGDEVDLAVGTTTPGERD